MKGWVCLVGWSTADGLRYPHKWLSVTSLGVIHPENLCMNCASLKSTDPGLSLPLIIGTLSSFISIHQALVKLYRVRWCVTVVESPPGSSKFVPCSWKRVFKNDSNKLLHLSYCDIYFLLEIITSCKVNLLSVWHTRLSSIVTDTWFSFIFFVDKWDIIIVGLLGLFVIQATLMRRGSQNSTYYHLCALLGWLWVILSDLPTTWSVARSLCDSWASSTVTYCICSSCQVVQYNVLSQTVGCRLLFVSAIKSASAFCSCYPRRITSTRLQDLPCPVLRNAYQTRVSPDCRNDICPPYCSYLQLSL